MRVKEPTSLHILRTATNLLANWIGLVPGVPIRVHFTDEYWIKRQIQEKESGKIKWVDSHVFYVDELGGEPCSRTFSILSEKLDAHLKPFLDDKLYSRYDFIITKIGDGFYADFNVQPILRPE